MKRRLKVELTPEDLNAIESASAQIKLEGARYPEFHEKLVGSRIDLRAICLAHDHVDSGAVGITTPKPVAKVLSKPFPIVGVYLRQLEVFDALKVRSVPREQRHIVRQSNTSDQTVAHSYLSACTFKFAPNVSRVLGGSTI